jgi:hypothetical protein
MDTDLERRAEKAFERTLDATAAERPAALIAACGGDAALLARVRELLAADEAGGFMGETAGYPAPPNPAAAVLGESAGSRIGRYHLLEKIGEGGFGVVFMAEQEKPVRRRVALKVIKLGMDTREVVARFEAERQALAMMDHPNIAKVLDAGATETGRPYFVMELVRGSPITEYADKRKLNTKGRIELAALVCRAVQHAHSKGVIHRDLKPSNVLVTVADDKAVPKVIDFGIAKATQSKLTDRTLFTSHRQLIGTPQYMSPEQADSDGVDVDTRTDVYSLGVLLYELLVGSTPMDGKALRSAAFEAMRKMIREVDPAKPSTKLSALGDTAATVAAARGTDAKQLSRQLHGELDWIVMKALEKDRSRRYETAAAMADDLGRYLTGEAVLAGPMSGAYRLKKTLKRYRVAVLTGGVIAAVLLLGVFGTTSGLIWARHEEGLAVLAERRATDQAALAETEKSNAIAAQAQAEQARSQADQARVQAEQARKQAEQNRAQAEQARAEAEQQATAANRAAARSDARYLTSQQLLPAAYARAVDAWKSGGLWEDGFTLDCIRAEARKHWQVATRIPVDGATTACFVQTRAGPVLAVASGSNLTTYDANTGQKLQQALLSSPVFMLIGNDALESVTAIRKDGVERRQARDLQQVASHALASPAVTADANATEVLIVDRGGASRVLALKDLSAVATLDWDTDVNRGQNLGRPHLAAISPSGNRILLRGGPWNEAYTLWERGNGGPPRITHFHSLAMRFRFIDENLLLAWYVADPNGGTRSLVNVYDLSNAGSSTPPSKFSGSAGSEDTKETLDVQAWPDAGNQSANIALLGATGVTILSTKPQEETASDRYANLLPTDGDPPTYLAASLAAGLLATREAHSVVIFRALPLVGNNIADFSAHGCRDGMLYVQANAIKVSMFLQPFDATKPLRTFTLQWAHGTGATPEFLPWAVCATPDGSTVVVIAQESKNFHNTVAASFGDAHALVYHNAGGVEAAPPTWQLDRELDLHVAPTGTWDKRFAAIDPTGEVLVYGTAYGGTKRFSLADGKVLGMLPLAGVTHLSDDGMLAAGIDPTSGNLNVFNISTGEPVMAVTGQGKVTAVCLSADDQRVLVGDGEAIRSYAVADGRLLSTIPSSLRPLTAPAGESGRLVALQPDEGTSDSGNLVLADTSGRVVTVLARTGTGNCQAWFSPDGRAVAVLLERWRADVFRSLSPDQLIAALNQPMAPGGTTPPPAAAATVQLAAPPAETSTDAPAKTHVLDAANTDELATRLGTSVDVRGTIQTVTWTVAHNALNIEFTGPDDKRRMMGWIPPQALGTFTAALKGVRIDDLTGREVEIKGSLVRYSGRRTNWMQRFQVSLTAPSQFQLLPVKP